MSARAVIHFRQNLLLQDHFDSTFRVQRWRRRPWYRPRLDLLSCFQPRIARLKTSFFFFALSLNDAFQLSHGLHRGHLAQVKVWSYEGRIPYFLTLRCPSWPLQYSPGSRKVLWIRYLHRIKWCEVNIPGRRRVQIALLESQLWPNAHWCNKNIIKLIKI